MHRQMVLMRYYEQALLEQSKAGVLRGSLHLAEGQEAVPVGVCKALRPSDAITATYRGHGYVLAKGCDLRKVTAEIMGRKDGLGGGKGGKMHLFDPSHGLLGTNGIVAGGIPTAVGAALSAKTLKNDRVAVTVFGDGAVNQGAAHESFNMAALFNLPVLFIYENNLYAEMTPLSGSAKVTSIAKRMSAYGIEAITIDGNDVQEVYNAAQLAVDRARRGEGPSLIEAMTYRTCGHYQLDPGLSYRTKEEVEAWVAKSPITRLEWTLQRDHNVTEAVLEESRRKAREAVEDAIAFGVASPPAEGALTGVYA